MNLNFTPEENAFRKEVRDFVATSLPPDIQHKVLNGLILDRDDYVRWQKILHRKGWAAPAWKKEFGGTGWNTVQQYIFEEECAAAGAPRTIPFGLKMVAPVIMQFGSPAQQERFLPKILAADEWWCQGYSEPGAGSDLASLKTRAELVKSSAGDHYVVNGQKTWTTQGQYADWIFCLVRTDPEAKPQRGISFLLIDMKTPGISVRPIITMDGAHEVNEVWFEDVRVPAENLVGEENAGWTYAKFLLGHERTNIAGIGIAKRELARLKRIASLETKNGRPLIRDPLFAARIAQVEIDLTALEITNLRVLAAEAAMRAPGPEASILKIKGTEIQQAITELLVQAVGPYALQLRREAMAAGWQGDAVGPFYAVPLAAQYLNMRKLSIYGGSNEIQKNIISQMILGL
ncbi:MAG TPA: acyl-CoA dehydrogenase family protein [Noviherbaspirillum sp.]|uniref:acyl-CoA dehydrogenase family protein n=1 Tax=Noviherbaspirillum sp. TaxID=1926288 RepID=UPI002D692761|nr:acyl-CoA dehydrogenase family protein [Noviherbaspirillum sp.]HYD93910.1 acyl-CoA dehydrogenase family protein [Noviherbaspirillum sp.]